MSKTSIYNDGELVAHVTNPNQPMVVNRSYTRQVYDKETGMVEKQTYQCTWITKKGKHQCYDFFEEELKPYKKSFPIS